MSDSSRAQLRYLAESSWGVIPSAAMTELPFTSESLKQTTQVVDSEQIRSDRQIPDVIRTQVGAQGDINYELLYGAYDDLFEGVLNNDWSTAVNISATDIAASNTNSRFDSTSTDFTGENIQVGQWLKVGGFDGNGGENNGFYRVTAIDTNALTVTPAPASDEAAGDTVTMKGEILKNGTTKKSFVLEKEFNDVTEFLSYVGCRFGSMRMTIAPGAIVTGVLSAQGKSAAAAGATVGTGAANAAPANEVMNAVDNVAELREGATILSDDLTQLSFQVENNQRGQPKVGQLGLRGIGVGRVRVSGTIEAYFESRALFEKYLNFTTSSLSWLLQDDAGNAYMVDFPQLKFTDGDVPTPGIDEDIIARMAFTAVRHPTDGFTFAINRFAA